MLAINTITEHCASVVVCFIARRTHMLVPMWWGVVMPRSTITSPSVFLAAPVTAKEQQPMACFLLVHGAMRENP
jgi:hypothetical protein